MVDILKNNLFKVGWQLSITFQIKLHVRDTQLILDIQSFFNNIGTISFNNEVVVYKVRKLNDILNIIIPHFDQYPLITLKRNDYAAFKNIILLIRDKKHLEKIYLNEIITLKASLNKGLSDNLRINFPNIIKLNNTELNIPLNIDPNWIAGFYSGEGCFMVSVYENGIVNIKYDVRLTIILTQHVRDKFLMDNIRDIFNSGSVRKPSKRNAVDLNIRAFKDIYEKLIPFFIKYKILGVKSKDFKDFCLVADLMKKKIHLTKEGVDKIKKIQSGMNKKRIFNNNRQNLSDEIGKHNRLKIGWLVALEVRFLFQIQKFMSLFSKLIKNYMYFFTILKNHLLGIIHTLYIKVPANIVMDIIYNVISIIIFYIITFLVLTIFFFLIFKFIKEIL